MVLRLEEEYGDEIKGWLEGERAQDTAVFRDILKEWHIRADESYITRHVHRRELGDPGRVRERGRAGVRRELGEPAR